ncbi:hypothetical protein ACROYT_G015428 [Oculina patagonica]
MTTKKPKTLTKRLILSQVNSVYDPLGLASLLIVRAKILMRQLWIHNPKLDWDDPIPEEDHQNWDNFFQDLSEMEKIQVNRCTKPKEATGNPILVIFCDGSNDAYGACAYARWTVSNGDHETNLILSKNRLTPSKKLSIDWIELCAAVLNKRLKSTITENNADSSKIEMVRLQRRSDSLHSDIRYGLMISTQQATAQNRESAILEKTL